MVWKSVISTFPMYRRLQVFNNLNCLPTKLDVCPFNHIKNILSVSSGQESWWSRGSQTAVSSHPTGIRGSFWPTGEVGHSSYSKKWILFILFLLVGNHVLIYDSSDKTVWTTRQVLFIDVTSWYSPMMSTVRYRKNLQFLCLNMHQLGSRHISGLLTRGIGACVKDSWIWNTY